MSDELVLNVYRVSAKFPKTEMYGRTDQFLMMKQLKLKTVRAYYQRGIPGTQ